MAHHLQPDFRTIQEYFFISLKIVLRCFIIFFSLLVNRWQFSSSSCEIFTSFFIFISSFLLPFSNKSLLHRQSCITCSSPAEAQNFFPLIPHFSYLDLQYDLLIYLAPFRVYPELSQHDPNLSSTKQHHLLAHWR